MSEENRGYEVIDGDGHIVLPEGWWRPYLPQKYWEWAPQDGQKPEGRDFPWHWERPPGKLGYYPGGDDPKARLGAMDADGIDVAYLYPSQVLSLMPVLNERRSR